MRAALIAAVVTLCALAGRAAATPAEDLDHARQDFRARDWAHASEKLSGLFYPQLQLADRASVTEAHVLLGACRLELGDRDAAHAEFERALELDPELQLTTLSYSAGAVKLFEDVKVELRVRAEREEERRRNAEANQRIQEYLNSIVTVENHSYARNFVPFGSGQFQNGQYRKGVFFLVSEAATIGTSFVIYYYLVNTFGFSGTVDPKQHDPHDIRLLQQIEIGSGATFFALATWGALDSLSHYQPQTRVETDPTRLPPELRNLDKPATKPAPKKTSLRIGPILVPGGAGVGLAWER